MEKAVKVLSGQSGTLLGPNGGRHIQLHLRISGRLFAFCLSIVNVLQTFYFFALGNHFGKLKHSNHQYLIFQKHPIYKTKKLFS